MVDLYYKFIDRQEMLTLLKPLGMIVDGALVLGNHQYAAWEVGEILGVEGWHLNIRLVDEELDLSTLELYAVQPVNPLCRWA